MSSKNTPRIDGLTLAGLALLVIFGVNLLTDHAPQSAVAAGQAGQSPAGQSNADRVIAPYEKYVVTQGPHGQSYGQLAIDLAAGKGAVIRSPIAGTVSALYVDGLGNTTLIIDNPHYQVTLLHGIYEVQVGEQLKLGQPVGYESNQGYTVDAYGNLCSGRDCGYHTHLNIFDKLLNENVNPLNLIQK
jgi:murein DD-endopeptidase MepM/ murein hydrolase activator NlpD